jgi:hypothetical protein
MSKRTPGFSLASNATAPARLWHIVAGLAFAAYLFVATFPRLQQFEGPIETSWELEINRLVSGPYAFGRDAVFTYGPLGFLLYPLDVGANVVWAWGFRLLLHALFAALIGRWVLRRGSVTGAVAVAVALAVAIAGGLDFEYECVLVAAMLAVTTLETHSRAALAAAAALAALGLFAKTSLGVGALAAVGVVAVLWIPWSPQRRGPLFAAAGAGAGLLAGALLLSSVRDLPGWLARGLDLASGYSAAMAYPSSSAALTARAALVLGAFVALAAWTLLRRPSTAAAALAAALAPGVFLAYKHSIVRLDEIHAPAVFAVTAAAAGLVAVVAADRVVRAAAVAVALVALVAPRGAVPAVAPHGRDIRRAALLDPGAARLREWVALGALRRDLSPRRFVERLEPWYEAVSWPLEFRPARVAFPELAEVARGRTVGVVGQDQWLCFANGLDCVPAPVVGTYSTYTAALDRWSAAGYAGDRAPDLLVVPFQAIDGRNLALEAPATMAAVHAWYDPAPRQAVPGALLLARRAQPRRLVAEPLSEVRVAGGAWTPVPDAGGRVLLTPDLRLGWRGLLKKTFVRVPPVTLEVRRASGALETIVLVADSARNGLVVSDVPRDLRDFARTFGGRVEDRVVAVRFAGEALHRSFRLPLRLTWSALREVSEDAGAAAAAHAEPERRSPVSKRR